MTVHVIWSNWEGTEWETFPTDDTAAVRVAWLLAEEEREPNGFDIVAIIAGEALTIEIVERVAAVKFVGRGG